MYIPYYNITGKNKEYEYSYLLYILVRAFGFKGEVTKELFIKKGISKGFKKSNLYYIWEKGSYINMFFRGINNNKIYLRSTDTFELIIEGTNNDILNNIRGIRDLRLFLHASFLGRAGYINKEGQNTSIGTRKIAAIYNTTRQTINNRNKKAIKFNLDITNRYCKTDEGYNIRTTNEYKSPTRVIKNKYCKMIIKHTKLIKEFVLPLIINNAYVGDLLNSCKDINIINEFYEYINNNIFNGKIYNIIKRYGIKP